MQSDISQEKVGMIRTKWMDPDFRRDPKTGHYCVICQRDLTPSQQHRVVWWELDKWAAIHPDDWIAAALTIPAERKRDDAIEQGAIGMDCARRLGLDWSAPPEAVRSALHDEERGS